jgi:hypothetical protein
LKFAKGSYPFNGCCADVPPAPWNRRVRLLPPSLTNPPVIASGAKQSLLCCLLRLLRPCAPRNDRDNSLPVIASEAKQSPNSRTKDFGCCCASVLQTKQCHCERSEAISHNSSYKSRHSLFMLLIKLTFFCLEPPLICFSLKMAFSMSSNTS